MPTPAATFRRFFAETDKCPHTQWEIEGQFDVHMVDSEFVIELLSNLPNDDGARQLRDQLVRLDFANAEILPWLEHLAHGFVAQDERRRYAPAS